MRTKVPKTLAAKQPARRKAPTSAQQIKALKEKNAKLRAQISTKPSTPEAEVERLSLEQWHPAELAVALHAYFGLKYREIPPDIPSTIFRDGCTFSATGDRRDGMIAVSVKTNAISHEGVRETTTRKRHFTHFDKIFLPDAGL